MGASRASHRQMEPHRGWLQSLTLIVEALPDYARQFYYEWSKAAVVIGVVAGLGLVIALGLTRRRLLSALCSAVGCGLIAFCA